MSWDILAMRIPLDIASMDQLSADFKPEAIGPRDAVVARIREFVPSADFSDPSWGLIDGNDWSIEISTGAEPLCQGIAFHVRGGDEAAGVVAGLLQHLNLRAFDTQTGDFFQPGEEAAKSLAAWRSFRDRAFRDDG